MTKILRLLFPLFACFYAGHAVKAQELSTLGKVFWLTFMENKGTSAANVCSSDNSLPQMKIIISTKKANSGSIKNPNTGYVRNFVMTANSVDTFYMSASNAYVTGSESGSSRNMGLLVQTTDTVAVVAENSKPYSCDASLILPVEALGTNYRVVSAQGEVSGNNSCYKSSFVIVATEDNTKIEITPTVATEGGNAANTKFTITLNKGQTYQVKASTNKLDLSGTLVQALDCKKVALFGGAVRAAIVKPGNCTLSYDHLFEQMMPVEMWGKKFVCIPTIYAKNKTRVGEILKIVANSSGTTAVRCNGRLKLLSGPGASDTIYIKSNSVITTNKPIAVCQFALSEGCDAVMGGTDTDPFMSWVPPIEQSLKNLSFVCVNANTINKFFTNIIVKTAYKTTLLIDGAPPTATFQLVDRDTSYSFVQQDGLAQGRHTLSCPYGFAATVYAYGDHGSYGYSAGSAVKPLSISMKVDSKNSADFELDSAYFIACQGATVAFDGQADIAPNSWRWEFSDGFVKGSKSFNRTFNIPGTYTVRMITIRNANGVCNGSSTINDTNTQIINIFKHPDIKLLNDTVICRGNSVILKSQTDGDTNYTWSPPAFLSCTKCFEPVSLIPDSNITYTVVATTKGCLPTRDTVKIMLRDSLSITMPKDSTICLGQSITLNASAQGGLPSGYTFTWDNGLGTGPSKTVSPVNTTTYQAIITDGCTVLPDTAYTRVTVRDKLKINVNADTIICAGNSVSLSATAQGGNESSYVVTWDHGLGNGYTKTAAPGSTTTYRAILSDGCTKKNDTAYVTVTVRPAMQIQSFTCDSPVCKNTAFKITVKVGGGDSNTYRIKLYNLTLQKNLAIDSVKGKTLAVFTQKINLKQEQFKVSINQNCNNEKLADSAIVGIKQNTVLLVNKTLDSICEGQSYNLNVTANNSDGNNMMVKRFRKSGPSSYIPLDSALGSGSMVFTSKPSYTVDYRMVADDYCSLSDTTYFRLQVDPKAILTKVQDDYICFGDSVRISLQSSFGRQSQMTYQTSLSNNWIVSNSRNYTLKPAVSADYFVMADDQCSPAMYDTFRIWVSPEVSDSTILLKNNGCEPYTQLLNYPIVKSQPIPTDFTWQWQLGDNTSKTQASQSGQTLPPFSKTYNTAGTYHLTLQLVTPKGKVCETFYPRIDVWPTVVADFDYQPSLVDITDPNVIFNNQSQRADSYIWRFGDGGVATDINPLHTYGDTGAYEVTLVSSSIHGCKDSIKKKLRVEDIYRIFIPDAFSPNSDRFNDYFFPVATSVQSIEMIIYNRWGEKVYMQTSPSVKWDGTYTDTGAPCMEGIYIYTIKVRDNRKKWHYYSGHLTLVR